jgi:carboxypeptidase A4
VVEYAAYQLLISSDPTTAAFKNAYDFYIFPIVNPDGFSYSQTNDRMWRKNRQSVSAFVQVQHELETDLNHRHPQQAA